MLWYIDNYHPVVQQADLLTQRGKSMVRLAKGAFDPYLYTSVDRKEFDDKQYYNHWNSGLKVPTWAGIDLEAGFERNEGIYLNPENRLPPSGQWNAGLSIPLGQGLFIEKRRATLKQAKLYEQYTQFEQQQIINNLYFDAIKEYWEWATAWSQQNIYQEAVELAKARFSGVKQSFTQGDIPAIDTLEAYIQLQNRQMSFNQAVLEYQNTTVGLSNYLWYEGGIPLIIGDSVHPVEVEDVKISILSATDSVQVMVDLMMEKHPTMQLYNYKLANLEVERKLRVEELKPQLDFKYNVLNEPANPLSATDLSLQNFKWGLEFNFPLFTRTARGNLQLTKLRILETQLEQDQKMLQLENKLRQYYNEQLILQDQIALYTDAVDNYQQLLEGEIRKFSLGESSLFLVNSRETNMITARLKLIELQTKYYQAYYGLLWAAGTLYSSNT